MTTNQNIPVDARATFGLWRNMVTVWRHWLVQCATTSINRGSLGGWTLKHTDFWEAALNFTGHLLLESVGDGKRSNHRMRLAKINLAASNLEGLVKPTFSLIARGRLTIASSFTKLSSSGGRRNIQQLPARNLSRRASPEFAQVRDWQFCGGLLCSSPNRADAMIFSYC